MPNPFVDRSAPSLQGGPARRPGELPHGFVPPTERVRAFVGQEKAKFAPTIFTPEAEERLLCEWTLQEYFDGLGHEVAYRSHPTGPEVLAVGAEEVLALAKDMPPQERLRIQTWMP